MLVAMDLLVLMPGASSLVTTLLVMLALRGLAALRQDWLGRSRAEPPPPVPSPAPPPATAAAPVAAPVPTPATATQPVAPPVPPPAFAGGAVIRQTIRRAPERVWVAATGTQFHLTLACQYTRNQRGRRELELCLWCQNNQQNHITTTVE